MKALSFNNCEVKHRNLQDVRLNNKPEQKQRQHLRSGLTYTVYQLQY